MCPQCYYVTCVTAGLDVVGIYRLSGNAAQIQKLRHRTDQGMYVNYVCAAQQCCFPHSNHVRALEL